MAWCEGLLGWAAGLVCRAGLLLWADGLGGWPAGPGPPRGPPSPANRPAHQPRPAALTSSHAQQPRPAGLPSSPAQRPSSPEPYKPPIHAAWGPGCGLGCAASWAEGLYRVGWVFRWGVAARRAALFFLLNFLFPRRFFQVAPRFCVTCNIVLYIIYTMYIIYFILYIIYNTYNIYNPILRATQKRGAA